MSQKQCCIHPTKPNVYVWMVSNPGTSKAVSTGLETNLKPSGALLSPGILTSAPNIVKMPLIWEGLLINTSSAKDSVGTNSLLGGIYRGLSLNQLIRLNLACLETSALGQSRSECANARPLKGTGHLFNLMLLLNRDIIVN